MEKDPEAS